MPTLWHNFHAITMQQGQYQIINDAVMVTEQGKIQWLAAKSATSQHYWQIQQQHSLAGSWVTPGFVDCHSHLVFAGDRSGEFEQRLQGVSYAQIAAAGGGIARTVQATRQASSEQLLTLALARAKRLLTEGVTTLEIKSGYGLTLASERKLLTVIKQIANHLPLTVRSTCLAAHTIPAEYQADGDAYIADLCQSWLPSLAQEGLIDAVDAFCETIAFSPAQVEKLFIAAKQLQLPVKLHAEQLSNLRGSGLAARYQALSADHLEYLTEPDIQAMAKADTLAVLLPAAFYTLRETQKPPIDLLRRYHVKMAIASDLNPGTSPILSPRLLLNMACTLFQLTPEEALAGLTLHAAQALGLAKDYGSLEVGKQADFLVWQIGQPAELAYWIGGEPPSQVVKAGQIVDFAQLPIKRPTSDQ